MGWFLIWLIFVVLVLSVGINVFWIEILFLEIVIFSREVGEVFVLILKV